MHCKSYSHFFSKKFQHICVSLDVNFNESLTNDIVSFEQLGPDFLHESIYCGCSFELHRQVDAIQMGTHNICLYKEADKKYTGCNLKTPELLDCALIGLCAVIRSNAVCFHGEIRKIVCGYPLLSGGTCHQVCRHLIDLYSFIIQL